VSQMIVLRFRAQVRPDRVDEVASAFAAVVPPSRRVEGVLHFDVGRDVGDPSTFIATEVFADAAARERQESLPEVAEVMRLLPDALAAPPEATVYHTHSSEPAM
jgi:quinol monooxygenase YgiN